MENNEIVVGLDIGTTKICAIVGRANEYGKIDILGMGKSESEGVKRGVVINIQKTVNSIHSAIEQAAYTSGVDINRVFVGIAGQHIKSLRHRGMITRNNEIDEIDNNDIERLNKDMNKLVMQPGEEIIHVIPQEYIVDNETGIKDPIGMAGIRLEANFHIITGQVTAIRNIYRCVERAGLYVDGVILEPLASSDSVLTDDEKEAGVALVDIGGGTTDIAIFKDGIIRHTAVIPLAGNIITEDIREGCSVMLKQAEAMKIKFGSALANEATDNEIIAIPGLKGREAKEISVKNLAHIIQARVTEIFEHVMFEIKNSGYQHKLIAGIVVTGGGSQLKHIAQLIEYVTGIDARVGYPTEHLSKGMTEEVSSPMFSTGIGLVLKGLNTPIESDMPEKPLDSAKSEKKNNPTGSFLDKIKGWFNEVDDYEH